MQQFKCKICAGELEFTSYDLIAICPYCQSKQVLPKAANEKTEQLYTLANSYLQNNEFDKAERIYIEISTTVKNDPEVYWQLAMCKYGISYVTETSGNRRVPTVNRTYLSSILEDENYKKALELANSQQRDVYIENAQYINAVQQKIIAVSRKEKPFDIFICYKETAETGGRTRDSVLGQKLYEKLTEKGYKVFFSRITLEDKIGAEYEPFIFSALHSSKVMLCIGSSITHFEAVWVKNEWSRYLRLVWAGEDKTLIPLVLNDSEVPEEFKNLMPVHVGAVGFEQDLFRGIKKLIPTPVLMAKYKKKRNKILSIAMAAFISVLALFVIAVMIFKPQKNPVQSVSEVLQITEINKPEYDTAMKLYNEHNYPEACWAFEALGDYKDSVEMRDKAERSWRNSLASVTAIPETEYSSEGSYYITLNGMINTFIADEGVLHEQISIDEHGKVVSIKAGLREIDSGKVGFKNGVYYMDWMGVGLYALREDGYVTNAMELNSLSAEQAQEWHNIVQISETFFTTSVALRSDGKLVFGNSTDYMGYSDDWLSPAENWENIVKFDYFSNISTHDGKATLIGIDHKGNIHIASNSLSTNDISKLEAKFSNVKTLSFDYSILHILLDANNNYETYYALRIAALTFDNKLQIYDETDDSFNELADMDAVNVDVREQHIVILKSDSCLYEIDKTGYLLSDVTNIDFNNSYHVLGFAITKSGVIYKCIYDYNSNKITAIETEGKTKVYDEWLERFD